MEKYSNVMSNMAWATVRAVKRAEGKDVNDARPDHYKWESSKLNAWQRRQHENVRDQVHIESILLVKEEADKKKKLNALVEFAVDHNITAEQMASQVVQQWVTTLVPKRPYSYVSRETD
jgi:hypothetical protein